MTPAEIFTAYAACILLAAIGVAVLEATAALGRRLKAAETAEAAEIAAAAKPQAPWDHTAHDALDPPTPTPTPTPHPASRPPDQVVSLGANEAPMSDLSNIKNEFLSFVEGVMSKVPAQAQPEVQAAAASVSSVISNTEAALVSTAAAEAPTVISSVISKDVPAEFQPLASLALQLGIAALTAKAGV